MSKYSDWADSIIPIQTRLTDSVMTILRNLLDNSDLQYLSLSGRTKNKQSLLEKISRKGYKHPEVQMTDISGIRVIVFLESDIEKVCNIIEGSFHVDEQNSLNQDERLSTNQIGYRSVHYVCDLGQDRTKLPEFTDFTTSKFEIQVRTVLQHAWAELAHDRNYKFSGKLPPEIERNLYLYAGMLEIADKGFNDLAIQIENHVKEVHHKNAEGDLDYTLDTLSLRQFVENWASKNKLEVSEPYFKSDFSDLILELEQFGIKNAKDLNAIIPENYAAIVKELAHETTIFGYVRDWMLIHDWRKFIQEVSFNWVLADERDLYNKFFDEQELAEFEAAFEHEFDEEPFAL
ncbi:GTP pyrophosphokinase [Vibrio alginolyticus]|nr:GTP pyrophosphokinase [Vibrio alginolyticus]